VALMVVRITMIAVTNIAASSPLSVWQVVRSSGKTWPELSRTRTLLTGACLTLKVVVAPGLRRFASRWNAPQNSPCTTPNLFVFSIGLKGLFICGLKVRFLPGSPLLALLEVVSP
jgi:hypothetical protein